MLKKNTLYSIAGGRFYRRITMLKKNTLYSITGGTDTDYWESVSIITDITSEKYYFKDISTTFELKDSTDLYWERSLDDLDSINITEIGDTDTHPEYFL